MAAYNDFTHGRNQKKMLGDVCQCTGWSDTGAVSSHNLALPTMSKIVNCGTPKDSIALEKIPCKAYIETGSIDGVKSGPMIPVTQLCKL